jgi:hypothetical protein
MTKVKDNTIENDSCDQPLLDPLLVDEVELKQDFYSLAWTSLRTNIWKEQTLRGVRICFTASNYLWIKIYFLFFITIILATIPLLLYSVLSTDIYTKVPYTIIILRITLVTFAQVKIAPELYQGIAKFKYTLRKPKYFQSYCFAILISLMQIFISAFTFFAIILFVCMSDDVMELVMNFAGMSILSELDDWVGELICKNSPRNPEDDDEEDNSEYDLNKLNERMSIFTKMSMLTDDLTITEDNNTPAFDNCICLTLSWIVYSFPWFLLPLSTIVVEYWLCKLQPSYSP